MAVDRQAKQKKGRKRKNLFDGKWIEVSGFGNIRQGEMKLRKLWLFIGFLMVLAVVVFSLIPEPPSVGEYKGIDKLEHGLAYGCLMLWFVQLYSRTGTRWIIAFFLVLLGIVIEYLQGFSGYRSFEYADMLANTVGVLLGLLLSHTPLAGILERVEGILARK